MHRPPDMQTVRIAARTQVAPDTIALDLESATGAALAPFDAGAHIDVHLPGNVVRQYSLCSAPSAAGAYRIAIRREAQGRGGSRLAHDALLEFATMSVGQPRNLFPLDMSASESWLFAGGIGITPLIAMAYALHAAGRLFQLHYSARSRGAAAFADELLAQPWGPSVRLHLSDGGGAGRLNVEEALGRPMPGTHLYVCGPQAFSDALIGTARRQGWADEQIHFELFSASPTRSANDGGFEVMLASSKRVIRIAPERTVVEALHASGIEIPTSCEQGICGTCLTTVLQGRPDHRDSYLTDAERARNDRFLPCCSRSLDPCLVLDL